MFEQMPKYTQNHIDLINWMLDNPWRKVVLSYLEDLKKDSQEKILQRKELEEPKYTQDHLRRLQIEVYDKIINIKESIKQHLVPDTDSQA